MAKVVARPPLGGGGRFSARRLGLARYPAPSTPIPIIKNEELILLRAEANIGKGALDLALTDLNTIRQTSGGLPPVGPFADATAAVDELLYNRLFSLLYEGGYRWIDLRRYGRLALASAGGDLPLSRTGAETAEAVYQTYPIPSDETAAR